MSFEIVQGTRHPDYLNRCGDIVRLYNEAGNPPETLRLNIPELTALILADGVEGGILLDHHEQGFYRIMFAAWHPDYRGEGYLSGALQHAANAGLHIMVVERNFLGATPTDDLWRHLGFIEECMVGFTPCLAKPGWKDYK